MGAAPHLPAGVLSPYSDGERGAVTDGFANLQRCKSWRQSRGQPLSPRLRGEMPGRAMRGSPDFGPDARLLH
ncbi:hypothetical protein EN745_22235 [Mesorhizobium sp. M4A.F.Ca.ET.022.05.2.1]|nr:hypothetical protein EN745_22235 [Mesorhizobium sp. M4A.F.Ca.ET.022.05.2.1]